MNDEQSEALTDATNAGPQDLRRANLERAEGNGPLLVAVRAVRSPTYEGRHHVRICRDRCTEDEVATVATDDEVLRHGGQIVLGGALDSNRNRTRARFDSTAGR
jgi:hypothetical protein